MANPTTNFGWQMPTSTDLVTDLPADFEVFGQAVDTSLADLKGGTTGQILAKNSNTDMDFVWTTSSGMTNPMTTTGDTIYSSSGSTPARLGIGSSGQVLTVSGGLPTWATTTSIPANYSLVSSTALSGTTTTVSSISGADKLLIIVQNASDSASGNDIRIRFNSDTAANYNYFGWNMEIPTTYAASMSNGINGASSTYLKIGSMSANAGSAVNGYFVLDGCNSSGVKVFSGAGSGSASTSSGQQSYAIGGYYNSSSTISSVSIITSGSGFDSGNVIIYKTA